jgi:hypothetical protein
LITTGEAKDVIEASIARLDAAESRMSAIEGDIADFGAGVEMRLTAEVDPGKKVVVEAPNEEADELRVGAVEKVVTDVPNERAAELVENDVAELACCQHCQFKNI